MKATDYWNRGCGHDSNDSGIILGIAGVTLKAWRVDGTYPVDLVVDLGEEVSAGGEELLVLAQIRLPGGHQQILKRRGEVLQGDVKSGQKHFHLKPIKLIIICVL